MQRDKKHLKWQKVDSRCVVTFSCGLPDIIGILFEWQLLKSSISVIVTEEMENRAVFGYVTVVQKHR